MTSSIPPPTTAPSACGTLKRWLCNNAPPRFFIFFCPVLLFFFSILLSFLFNYSLPFREYTPTNLSHTHAHIHTHIHTHTHTHIHTHTHTDKAFQTRTHPTQGILIRTLKCHTHWVNNLCLTTDFTIRTGAFDPGKPSLFDPSLPDLQLQQTALERYRAETVCGVMSVCKNPFVFIILLFHFFNLR